MKIKSVEFGKNEEPKTLTVEMTVKEAAMIYAFVGPLAPIQISDHGSEDWLGAFEGLCDLSGFFNTYWESGWSEVGPTEFTRWYREQVKYYRKICPGCDRPCDWPNDYCHCRINCEVDHNA